MGKSAEKKMPGRKKEKNIQALAIKFIQDPSNINFSYLYERINWGLRKYIYNIVQDNTYVDEVLSETLENIYFKREQFNPEIGNFSTWIYKIARNNALKFMQKKSKSQNIMIDTDFERIYESELTEGNITDSDEEDSAYISTTEAMLDIVFDGLDTKIYDKERLFNEMYDASVNCISYLPDNLRVVMRDRLLYNKKIDDIAIDNGIPVSSVKNWLRKGKVVLQEEIQKRYSYLYNMFLYNV